MKLELEPREVDFLKVLLEKELGETRVEIHHTSNTDFKTHLQEREKLSQALIDRIKTTA